MKTKAIMGIMLTLFLMGVLTIPVMANPDLPDVLEEELDAVDEGVDPYHHVEDAVAAGYVPMSPHVPGMGVHYVNIPLIIAHAGTFVLEEPEVLLFIETEDDDWDMVAVEYIVITGGGPPSGFTGSSDEWHPPPPEAGLPPGTWTLHVWLFDDYENPLGIFEPFNPTIPP